jgi:hypothetical protein
VPILPPPTPANTVASKRDIGDKYDFSATDCATGDASRDISSSNSKTVKRKAPIDVPPTPAVTQSPVLNVCHPSCKLLKFQNNEDSKSNDEAPMKRNRLNEGQDERAKIPISSIASLDVPELLHIFNTVTPLELESGRQAMLALCANSPNIISLITSPPAIPQSLDDTKTGLKRISAAVDEIKGLKACSGVTSMVLWNLYRLRLYVTSAPLIVVRAQTTKIRTLLKRFTPIVIAPSEIVC